MKLWAKVTGKFEGIHFYIDAQGPEEFLKYPHRHMFYYTILIEQFHDNRDVEYIAFKTWIRTLLVENNYNYKSCEMIAADLINKIKEKFPGRDIKAEILEDGENGTIVEYKAKEEKK